MKQKGLARGYLTISGDFFRTHRHDVEALVAAEEKRAAAKNPTGRIIGEKRSRSGALTLMLSTEHLAQRLGHALQKAYGGSIDYGFSHENKLARATWSRDD